MPDTYLHKSEVEITLALRAGPCSLIWSQSCHSLKRLLVLREEHAQREVIPVDLDGKVVPGLRGEWSGEKNVEASIEDLERTCICSR